MTGGSNHPILSPLRSQWGKNTFHRSHACSRSCFTLPEKTNLISIRSRLVWQQKCKCVQSFPRCGHKSGLLSFLWSVVDMYGQRLTHFRRYTHSGRCIVVLFRILLRTPLPSAWFPFTLKFPCWWCLACRLFPFSFLPQSSSCWCLKIALHDLVCPPHPSGPDVLTLTWLGNEIADPLQRLIKTHITVVDSLHHSLPTQGKEKGIRRAMRRERTSQLHLRS